jgi:hypothetical protein
VRDRQQEDAGDDDVERVQLRARDENVEDRRAVLGAGY